MRVPIFLLILHILIFCGCAGLNPNPGERSADMNWEYGNYQEALSYIEPAAKKGEPWAQLRLGIMYELGVGVEKNIKEAIIWYKKVAIQQGKGNWANGKIVGAIGRGGYFNQHSDALIAQYQLANIYLRDDGVDKKIIEAYLLIKNVLKESNNKNIFYLQNSSGSQWITVEMLSNTLSLIEKEMTIEQKEKAEEISKNWTPEKGL